MIVVVDEIEMTDVLSEGVLVADTTDVLAVDTTDVFSADATDVLSAAKGCLRRFLSSNKANFQ